MKTLKIIFISTLSWIAISCNNDVKPKPFGYFRFDLPQHEYMAYSNDCGVSFEQPTYSKVYPGNQDCWMNLFIGPIKGTVHITYEKIKGNLNQFVESSQDLVYEHTSKAEGIRTSVYEAPEKNVHGILYELIGNTASSVQFYATDSLENFMRGALYFYSAPNKDSLAPLIDFATEDIRHLMSTIEWN